MNIILYPHSAGATFSKMLRLFALPAATLLLIAVDRLLDGMDSVEANMLAALAIVLAGIPHGTLDVEIAAAHFGQNDSPARPRLSAAMWDAPPLWSSYGCSFRNWRSFHSCSFQ